MRAAAGSGRAGLRRSRRVRPGLGRPAQRGGAEHAHERVEAGAGVATVGGELELLGGGDLRVVALGGGGRRDHGDGGAHVAGVLCDGGACATGIGRIARACGGAEATGLSRGRLGSCEGGGRCPCLAVAARAASSPSGGSRWEREASLALWGLGPDLSVHIFLLLLSPLSAPSSAPRSAVNPPCD